MTTLHDVPAGGPPAGTPSLGHRHDPLRYWTKAGPIDAAVLEPDDVATIGERSEASVAAPEAYALFSLAVGTFLIGYVVSGLVPSTAMAGAIAPLLLLAGVGQFVGGLIGLRRDNAFTGTTFCLLGAHYAIVGVFLLLNRTVSVFGGASGTPSLFTLALELYAFAYITLVLGVVALRMNPVWTVLLLALVPGYTLTAMTIWFGTGVPGVVTRIGGYCLFVSAAFAAYAATAMIVNSSMLRRAMPLFDADGRVPGGFALAGASTPAGGPAPQAAAATETAAAETDPAAERGSDAAPAPSGQPERHPRRRLRRPPRDR